MGGLDSAYFDIEPDALPDMLSDGKRDRSVWRPGDGDGDPSRETINRNMVNLSGHPTWKIFVDEVSFPIVRGTKNEPPHHVYLDDRACYAIYSSNLYTNDELWEFWPFDFNHQGHIKQGRMNRGKPAWLDDSNTQLAQGKLRAKNKWFTFSGQPAIPVARPRRRRKTDNASEPGEDRMSEESEAPKTPVRAKASPRVKSSATSRTPESPNTARKHPTIAAANSSLPGSPLKRRQLSSSAESSPTKRVASSIADVDLNDSAPTSPRAGRTSSGFHPSPRSRGTLADIRAKLAKISKDKK